jgi:hypothetical protein
VHSIKLGRGHKQRLNPGEVRLLLIPRRTHTSLY